MFSLFKKETTEQMLVRSAKEMSERIIKGLKGKNSDYENVYKKEMRKLRTLQSDIVSPPCYVFKKEDYRDKKIKLHEKLLEESKKYFVQNIDNQIVEADVFARAMQNSPDPDLNEDWDAEGTKTYLLRNAAGGLSDFLQRQTGVAVGEPLYPGVFWRSDTMSKFINDRKTEKVHKDQKSDEKEKKENEDEFWGSIHKKIKDETKSFRSNSLLHSNITAESSNFNKPKEFEVFDNISNIISSLGSVDEFVSSEKEQRIREIVTTLQLTTFKNSPLSNILRDTEVPGGTGLDFMIKNYPNILVDMACHKALIELDRATVEIVEKKGTLELNVERYADLNVLERSLSHAVSEIGLLKNRLTREYKVFKTAKLNEKREEKEKRKASAREINDNLTYLFTKTDQNRNDLERFDPIGIRLRKYTEFLSTSVNCNPTKTVRDMLLKQEKYYVDLKEVKDFSYLITSSAKDIMRKYDWRQEDKSLSGIQYLIQKNPELMDKIMSYLLLSQLEKEVNDYMVEKGFLEVRQIPALDLEKYNNLMHIKNSINLEEAKESLQTIRREYDQELKKLALQTPDMYANYLGWKFMVDAKFPENAGGISEEDLRVLDTNDIEKFKALSEKHHNDDLLNIHLEWRKDTIMKIRDIESDQAKKGEPKKKDPKIVVKKNATEKKEVKKKDPEINVKKKDPEKKEIKEKNITINLKDFKVTETEFINKNTVRKDFTVKNIEKKGKLNIYKNGNFVLDELDKTTRFKDHELQKTSQGCWAVVLSDMLKYESIDLTQEDIRSYRAIPSYLEIDNDKYKESYEQNTGAASNLACHMNLIARVLPNMALHKIERTNFDGNIPFNVLKRRIIAVVKGQGRPLGISYGGHYRLVIGMRGDMVVIYDPLYKYPVSRRLDEMQEAIGMKPVEMFWFENINTELNDKNEPGYEIQRTIGTNNDIQSRIKYDSEGALQQQLFDKEKQEWLSFDDYIDKKNPVGIAKNATDGIDPEYVHGNYEAFFGKQERNHEAHIIYLPKKLKLKQQ